MFIIHSAAFPDMEKIASSLFANVMAMYRDAIILVPQQKVMVYIAESVEDKSESTHQSSF